MTKNFNFIVWLSLMKRFVMVSLIFGFLITHRSMKMRISIEANSFRNSVSERYLSPIKRSLVDCVNNSSIGLRLFYLKLLFNINTSNVFNSINWCLSEILLIFFAEVIHIFHSDFLWDFVYAIFSTL